MHEVCVSEDESTYSVDCCITPQTHTHTHPITTLFMNINKLMTEYSSLCPKLSKYLDTQLPSMDMYDSERNRWDKSRNSGQSHTPAGSSKVPGICVFTQMHREKCNASPSFLLIHTYDRLDGGKMGFGGSSAGSNHTSSTPLCLSLAALMELNSRMKVELFWPRGLSSPISPLLRNFASRLGSSMDYTGITDIPFLCLFALETFTHKGDQMKCLPAFSTNSRRCGSPGLPLLSWVSFYAQVDNMVIKRVNTESQGFYWLLIMIMTLTTNAHMLLISLPARQWIDFMQNAAFFPKDHRGNWSVHDKCLCVSEKTERTSRKNWRACVCAMCWRLPICITHSTQNSNGFTSRHLSLKDRNSPQTTIAQTSRKNTERAFRRGFQTADCGH